MKKLKLKLVVYELKIIINSLNEMRTKCIKENMSTDALDELILKSINILNK